MDQSPIQCPICKSQTMRHENINVFQDKNVRFFGYVALVFFAVSLVLLFSRSIANMFVFSALIPPAFISGLAGCIFLAKKPALVCQRCRHCVPMAK